MDNPYFSRPRPEPAGGSQAAALLYAGGPRELTSPPAYVIIVRTALLIEEVSCALFKR